MTVSGFALAQDDQDALKDIQREIKQKQQKIEQQLRQARELEQRLKKAELEIAETAKQLNRTQGQIAQNQDEKKSLEKKQRALIKQLKQQEGILAKQIRSAYMTGNHDYAKMIFNQENAGRFERVITYYKYLNAARQSEIETFRDTVASLKEVEANIAQKLDQLNKLLESQTEQKSKLALQQSERKGTLNQIEKAIDSEAAKIEQLQINEQALIKALEAAALAAQKAREAKAIPEMKGLASLKGRLLRPTSGRVQRLYGKRRQGQVRWKGVLINSQAGNSVKSIHDGKVLYADWLRGFGLVTVIDHGRGYMSLYGHNQALLKQVGDSVQAGETIALVGQSGGQSAPNLYFEIRHKGKALNPSAWVK
nr:peptidoglycan DD-metalloendopeptidase family protein [Aestuariibacter sp. AA17]